MVEEVERAVYIQVERLSHALRLRDALRHERVQQIAQHGHTLRPRVREVRLVDHLHGPVNDGFLDSLQPRLAAHDKLAERQHEIAFQRQRVFFLTVIEVDIQRIHIVAAVG